MDGRTDGWMYIYTHIYIFASAGFARDDGPHPQGDERPADPLEAKIPLVETHRDRVRPWQPRKGSNCGNQTKEANVASQKEAIVVIH